MDKNNTGTPSNINKKESVVYKSNVKQDGFLKRFFLRKTIRSIFFVLLLLAIPLSILVISNRKESGGPAVLTYWGLWEPKQVYDGIVAEFERQHPNVKIVYQKQDIRGLEKYVDRLSVKINGSGQPDIFRFHNSWVMQMRDLLLPLPVDVVLSSELETKYYDVIKKDLKVSGAYYGIPLEVDTLALFINNDLFSEQELKSPPTDWDDIVSYSKKLVVKEQGKIKQAGIALGAFDNIDHATDIMSLLFIQNGADLRDLTGSKVSNAEDASSFYSSFADYYGGGWNDTFESSKLAFAKGKVAMIFGYSWDVIDIKFLNPKLNFSVLPVPHLPRRNMTVASYWVEGVSAKTKHPKEAFEFLKFLSKKENLEKLYSEESKIRPFGEPYPRTDMADLLKDNQFIYPFVLQAKDAVSTIFSSDTHDGAMNMTLNAYLGNAIRSGSSRSSLEVVKRGVDEVLAKYEKPIIPKPK